jgi:hypothetical protein
MCHVRETDTGISLLLFSVTEWSNLPWNVCDYKSTSRYLYRRRFRYLGICLQTITKTSQLQEASPALLRALQNIKFLRFFFFTIAYRPILC